MSLDVQVLPGISERPTVGGIVDAWVNQCDEKSRSLLGPQPRVIMLRGRTPVARDDVIEPKASYFFDLSEANTLVLAHVPLEEWTDVEAETEDFGVNLSAVERERVASAWKSAGYSLWIQSMGGRGPHELDLLSALVRGVAEMCDGWIMVESPQFVDVPVGIYRPDELVDRAFELRGK